jgi:hypothetical protein
METMNNVTQKLDTIDTGSTARIDRRSSVLAQIEAALLADKLSVLELVDESAGGDPYNRGKAQANDLWSLRGR